MTNLKGVDMKKKMLILMCPKCGSGNVLTNLENRVCRKCGYTSEIKDKFVINHKGVDNEKI